MRKLLVHWSRLLGWMYGSYKESQQENSSSKNITGHATALCRYFLKLSKTIFMIFNGFLPTILSLLHSTGSSHVHLIKKRKKTQSITKRPLSFIFFSYVNFHTDGCVLKGINLTQRKTCTVFEAALLSSWQSLWGPCSWTWAGFLLLIHHNIQVHIWFWY